MLEASKVSRDPVATVRSAAFPFTDSRNLRHILTEIGDASIVLLGEATHGTHDFYTLRADITRSLIQERGFAAVAIEGDWPDSYRVNRYVQHGGSNGDHPATALAGFERFPAWMWRNTVVTRFIAWLRAHNAAIPFPTHRVGFYGLDLYSLHASMRAVVEYLEERDPAAAREARKSYGCFEEFGPDPDSYAWAASRVGELSCEEAVARELVALRQRRAELVRKDGMAAADEFFFAEQNARLARNAELYYRTMFWGRTASWNVRDQHMMETLGELLKHLRRRSQPPRIVVWAHNSHLGDARATEPGEDGQLNLGQLVRERHGRDCRLVGFTTYSGTVTAASDWGEPPERKQVRPALDGSHEALLHATGIPSFYVAFQRGSAVHSVLAEPRLERAIGVIYRPETERWSHYFHARLSDQFDAIIHIDETRALEPLEQVAAPNALEPPETFPSGV